MKLKVKAGQTSLIQQIFIQDSSQTDGRGLTGLVFNSASLTAYYKRSSGTASVSISLVTITTLGTYASGGFKEVDATNMPGIYEFHVPDAAIASGAKNVAFMLKGATNMAQLPIEIELDAIDYQDGVRAGLTALPNASAGAAGGLPTGDANARVDVSKVNGSAINNLISGRVDANAGVVGDKTGYALTQSFPSNFALLSIDGSGNVSLSGTNSRTVRSGTAQAGGASSITLDSGASSLTDFYKRTFVFVNGGTGSGQTRAITAYNGSTKVATVANAWATNPDATSTFIIIAAEVVVVDASGNVTLTSSEHTAIQSDVQTGLTSQGFTTARAGYMDVLNGIVAAIWANTTRTLSAFGFSVTVGTNNDKTGYALTAGEHTSIASDAQTGLTAQGYTTTRAGYLDVLNTLASTVWNALTSGFSTVGSIGKLLKDNVDAAVSSRSTYAGADTAGTTTLLSRLPQAVLFDGSGYVQASPQTDSPGTTTLLSRLSAVRTAFLDKLNITGNVASQADVQAIQNNTSSRLTVPSFMQIPASSSKANVFELYLYNEAGTMQDADSAPTITVINAAGTSRNDHLTSTTLTRIGTGHYRGTYTVQSTDSEEELRFEVSAVVGGNTRLIGTSAVTLTDIVSQFTATDRTTLNALTDTLVAMQGSGWSNETLVNIYSAVLARLATSSYTAPDNATIGTINTKLGTPSGASISADIAEIEADVDAIANGGGGVTVAGYAAGQDPATLLLTNPANKLLTDSTGKVSSTPVDLKGGVL